jgi:hypothetical protein
MVKSGNLGVKGLIFPLNRWDLHIQGRYNHEHRFFIIPPIRKWGMRSFFLH